jgi:hypothetical protein
VREIFRRYVEQGEPLVRIARWLSEQGISTKTGKPRWNPSTVWAILRNPAYTGQAAFGKTRVAGPATQIARPARQRGRRSGRLRPRARRTRALEPHRGARADHRGAVRARSRAARAQRPPVTSQHPPGVALARNPRLPRVRLRLLPQLHQPKRSRAPLLPLLGSRRLPPPRRTCLLEPTGADRGDRRARLDPGARAARGPRADRHRDQAATRDAPRRAPSQPSPRGPPTRSRARPERLATV